jgi:hypothetical protein
MHLVLAALGAELLQFQPFRRGFLVLGVGIIAVLALGALHGNDFAHMAPTQQSP